MRRWLQTVEAPQRFPKGFWGQSAVLIAGGALQICGSRAGALRSLRFAKARAGKNGSPALKARLVAAERLLMKGSANLYIAELLDAYADYVKEPITETLALEKWDKIDRHFKRQREAFYHAESLRVFVRDKTEAGTFESLQQEIYNGVVDTCEASYPDGYQRVVAVTNAAKNLPIDAHPLAPSTFLQDKHGICHQLANEERLSWRK